MKQYKNIASIPTRNYEGYLWEADEIAPQMIDEVFDFSKFEPKSYIIEALLFSKADNKSIHIRHSGREHIYEYDLNCLPKNAILQDAEFLPKRLSKVAKVCFNQLWIPQKDSLCKDMEVLKMKALIFTGFKKS